SEIVSHGRDDVPNTAARIAYVAGSARNDVNVEVRDGLPRRGPVVIDDIEPVGGVLPLQQGPATLNSGEERAALGWEEVFPARHMAVGYNKEVASRYRKGVSDCSNLGGAKSDAIRVRSTERTGRVMSPF
ncbi:MAG: hypothetical protein JWM33_1982, partial [Caulobacteraceae bacterium]|nr:hypothetical protein [Caulobacteraceae bacterium]